MTTVTVFRNAPPPLIGVCGVVPDGVFEAFEEELGGLEANGLLVERIDPDRQPAEAARFQGVTDALAKEGSRCLPLILVDGAIVSSGGPPPHTHPAPGA